MKWKSPRSLYLSFVAVAMGASILNSYAIVKKADKNQSLKSLQIANEETKTLAQKKSEYNLNSIDDQFVSWGLTSSNPEHTINIAQAWAKFNKKKEVIVAVIDTGIDYNHPFLKNNLHVIEGNLSESSYGVDFSKKEGINTIPHDDHGHGTHVSGIIKSISPEVKLLVLKYYNPNASGQDNLNATIKALEYAVEKNVDIINYSGGGPEPAVEELRVLKNAERKGILVVAAAGNEQSDIDDKKNAYYPASYGLANIITVTAYNQDMSILPSSNYGKKSVDVSAPGYRIKSSIPQGRSGFMTGTSQATAFVTGVAALLKSKHPEITADQMKEIIKNSSKKMQSFATKVSTSGKLDAGKAIELAEAKFGVDFNKSRTLAKIPVISNEEKVQINNKGKGKIIIRKSVKNVAN